MKTIRTFLLVICYLMPLYSAEKRLEVPSEMVIISSMNEVKAFFEKDIAQAKRAKAQSELAQSLYEFSEAMSQDKSKEYAALLLSMEYAQMASTPRMYRQAVDKLAATFRINQAVLIKDSISEITKRAREDHHLLYPLIESSLHQAIAENHFEAALGLCDDARLIARKMKEAHLGKKVNNFKKIIKKYQDEFERLADHYATLEKDPDNHIANGAVGRFESFIKGNWKRGIPYLAKGDDQGLAKMAAAEQDIRGKTAQMLVVADGWWNLAIKHKEDELRARSALWYQKALPDLVDIERLRAEKRLKELHEVTLRMNIAKTFTPLGIRTVFIKPGNYYLKIDATSRSKRPNTTIRKGFHIQTTEVTQGQWIAIMGTSPWTHHYQAKQGSQYPATNMTFNEAITFCATLSKVTGDHYRLPTREEWECAARANSTEIYHFGTDTEQLIQYAWFSRSSTSDGYLRHPRPVALKKANKWGLFDMCGNVWEYSHNPSNPRDSYAKHGGAYNSYHSSVTVEKRSRVYPESKSYDTGFRVVRVK